jgi:transketolase
MAPERSSRAGMLDPPYAPGGKEIATRKAFAEALAALGKSDQRIVVLDGDVKNSTYTEELEKVAPERFFEGYIAEQNVLGMTMGLAGRGKIAFASTFACFFTRVHDFIRVAAISHLNIKLACTHVGVSIGEDGPTQMGLEDLGFVPSRTSPLYIRPMRPAPGKLPG